MIKCKIVCNEIDFSINLAVSLADICVQGISSLNHVRAEVLLAKCNQRWPALRLGLSSNCNFACFLSNQIVFALCLQRDKWAVYTVQGGGGREGAGGGARVSAIRICWEIGTCPSRAVNATQRDVAAAVAAASIVGAASNQSTGGSTKQLHSFTITPTTPSRPALTPSPGFSRFSCVCVWQLMDAMLSPPPLPSLLLRPRCTLIDFAVFVLHVLNAAEEERGGEGQQRQQRDDDEQISG